MKFFEIAASTPYPTPDYWWKVNTTSWAFKSSQHYVGVRVIVLLTEICMWISYVSTREYDGHAYELLYLTYLSFCVTALSCICNLANVLYSYKKSLKHDVNEESKQIVPYFTRLCWALSNTTCGIETLVCIMYWSSVYNPKYGTDGWSVMAHFLNLIPIAIDLILGSFPVFLSYTFYLYVYGMFYTLFIFIYTVSGGTNRFGNTQIYPILDFGKKPAITWVVCLLLTFVGIPLFFGIWVCVSYYLRPATFERKMHFYKDCIITPKLIQKLKNLFNCGRSSSHLVNDDILELENPNAQTPNNHQNRSLLEDGSLTTPLNTKN